MSRGLCCARAAAVGLAVLLLVCQPHETHSQQALLNYWDVRGQNVLSPRRVIQLRLTNAALQLAQQAGQAFRTRVSNSNAREAASKSSASSTQQPVPDFITAVRQQISPPRARAKRVPTSWQRHQTQQQDGTPKGRSLLQASGMPMLDLTGQKPLAGSVPVLGNGVGSNNPFQTNFGSGYQQFFGGQGPSDAAVDPRSANGPRSTAAQASRTNTAGSQPETDPNFNYPRDSGPLLNPVLANADANNPYVAQAQTQAGRQIAAKAATQLRQAQQQLRSTGSAPALNARVKQLPNVASAYRKATQGMSSFGPVVTPKLAAYAPNGGDDATGQPPDVPIALRNKPAAAAVITGNSSSSPSLRAAAPSGAKPSGGAAGGGGGSGMVTSTGGAAARQQAAGKRRSVGAAQAYLDEYQYDVNPLSFNQQDSAAQDKQNLDLSQYVSAGPFANLVDPGSPDIASAGTLFKDLTGRIKNDLQASKQQQGAGQRDANGLSPQTEADLNRLLQLGYGATQGTVVASEETPQGLGDVVGGPAGRGFGYGEYDYYDYEGQDNPTGVPGFMQVRSSQQPAPGTDTPQFKSGPGGDFGPGGAGAGGPGGTRLRNTSVGEIAPFCQPPILICADRDLINFLATEIDQVRWPDNVLEYNSRRFRLERVADNLIDLNLFPIAGPTFNLNQVLALNFRVRNTIAALNGLNGIGTNRLALNTLAWDASRPDRFLPETFSWNSGALSLDNSYNRVDYVPTYIITGTGPGFATTSINFGPFTDFQVADFRS